MAKVQTVPVKAGLTKYTVLFINGGVQLALGTAAHYFGLERVLRSALPTALGGNTLLLGGAALFGLANSLAQGAQIEAREQLGVPHPIVYPCESDVSDKKARIKFIATCRALENTHEWALPLFVNAVACALWADAPLVAGVGTSLFAAARLFYVLGYATGDPNARLPGFFVSLLAYHLVMGWTLSHLVLAVAGVKF
mmetsp:Transcript_19523/g.47996  ORF Transcript_19523/g.47996 Transcript_19523/m.47996 type:complete len:196 (-) Transcript_19523:137-724(-)|eukprot:CAMPEP_0198308422 /NCGR_PEP_ID=MMETSP1450-20131203/1076_1 /TAXON_ID=753684 ORGANISM="Madagascaria erythrocladiodes, Strain CCMP3234" /NCGR_SAMPLE_ID=MMETSP1450 /ASSEMBLY_ACC=CAM_ASM_001115 /LENGTH=195 /DNA_ID=CAMNT_0044011083 /DNA_START=77 /DNA_END=664 /DNA_ORIENTATION=-